MKQFIRNYWWLIIVLTGSFICLNFLGFSHNYGDPINNYGFAYAIAKGEVPYLDFNTISTPLYAFIMSLGLHIFNNYLMFLLEQSLLVTICFFLLYKLFGKKSFIMFIITVVTMYANIIATYNFMCFFMMILIIYMEKKHNDKDYLIGILIALALLSKQTVGFLLIIPSLVFYHNQPSKLKKRFFGFLIPCFIFLIYLLINNCLYNFFDLCLFGLFDFLNNNGAVKGLDDTKYLIFSVIGLIILLIMILKNKKDINLYYLICGFFFTIPLFDSAHFAMFLNCITVAIMPYIKLDEKLVSRLSMVIFTLSSIFLFKIYPFELVFTSELKHFEYLIHDKSEYEWIRKTNNYINKYNDKNIIVIGYFSMHYSLYNDKRITYFDVLYRGNFGYNGTKKMISKIEKMHNYYFAVSLKDLKSKDKKSQFDNEIAKYITKNCEKISYSKKNNYAIYYKE